MKAPDAHIMEEARRSLARQWGLDLPDGLAWERLKAALEAHLAVLLDSDPERLVQIMYRLDVAEEQFRAAIAAFPAKEAAKNLTELVLARELRRIEFRMRYSGNEK